MDSKIELTGWKISALCCLFFVCVSILFLLRLVPDNLSSTPDSISYMDTAKNIRLGLGLVETNFAFPTDSEYLSFTTWPPLYPLLLSFFSSTESNALFSAFQLALILVSLNGILLFCITQRIIGAPLATLLSILVLVSSGNMIISAHVWSETLFITTLLLTVLFSQMSYVAAQKKDAKYLWQSLLLLALSLSAVFYTRYIGLVFGFVLPMIWWLSPNRQKLILPYSAATVLYGVLCAALMARNMILVGDITGGDVRDSARQASTLSLTDNLYSTFDALLVYIPLNVFYLIAVLFFSLLIVLYIHRLQSEGEQPVFAAMLPQPPVHIRRFLIILLSSMVIIYLVSLIVLRSVTTFDPVTVRFVAVIAPLLLTLLFIVLTDFLKRARVTTTVMAGQVCCFMFIVLIGLKSILLYVDTMENRATYGQPMFPVSGMLPIFYTDLTSPSNVIVTTNIVESLQLTENDLVITERPNAMAFITDIDFRRLEQGFTVESLQWLKEQNVRGYLLITENPTKQLGQEVFGYDDSQLENPVIAVRLGGE